MEQTLYFEKISRYDRQAEPVTVSIPFARGTLTDAAHLTIADPDSGASYPLQTRSLATWDDGSVKWLLVHLQPDLPGNADKTLNFAIDPALTPPAPQHTVSVSDTPDGFRVDTGPLAFTVSPDAFAPIGKVSLNGQPLFGEAPFGGFRLTTDQGLVTSNDVPLQLELEEAGPLRVVILVKGKHRRPDGGEYLDLRGRITAYAGKPYVAVEHQFIHAEEEPELSLQALDLTFRPAASGTPHLALGEGWHSTKVTESDDALDQLIDHDKILFDSNEHFIDCFYGDFWVDWRDETGGLTLSMYQAHQNFPKALRVTPEGIICSLYPEGFAPAPVLRGMGKRHRIMLHFHGPDTPLEELSTRSLQFQLPDVPSLPRSWYRENNPWVERFFPARVPRRFITRFMTMHDGRPKALGMFHFGDSPNASYTNQGRGRGESVWVNNEYDRPHACALFYALTGQRRVRDSGLVAARHWLDVDLCHYDPDPLIHGGLKIHTRYHATGGVTPSHEWSEGLLDYYFLTGRREALDAAISVGDNIVRHMAQPRMRTPGMTSVREGGWALRAMVGLYLGTGDTKWRDEAKRLVDMYLAWFEEYGALLAPYTSHSMPRVTFMISLTVNSFSRYLLIEDDERVKSLIVGTVDDMLAHCMGPDGVTYYKELPSLRRPHATPHILESLTHAYRVTEDTKYLEIGARIFAFAYDTPDEAVVGPKVIDSSGAVIDSRGWVWSCLFAERYTSHLLFAGEATPLGILDWFEYPY